MSIIDDMLLGLAQERAVREGKRSIGFPEPIPVFIVFNQHAFIADMHHRTKFTGSELSVATRSLAGVHVEYWAGNGGWKIEWR